MRTSQAARYARWAAVAAILLTATVAGVYFYRGWQGAKARKEAPPVVPPTVQQRSAEFSFSKVEGDRTLFTVRASRTTEFKEGSKSLLEEVWITIYGHAGRRFDNIHTRSCDYEPKTGRIICAGDVQMDLESSEEAHARPGQRAIHIRTANISFDRESGEARTDRPVEFRFPYGEGRGRGVTYSTRDATVRILGDVEFTLAPPQRPIAASASDAQAAVPEPIVFTAGSLEYRREDRTLHLKGPVRVHQGSRELTAGHLALEFDPALRARRLLVNEKPQLRAAEPGGELVLTAEEFITLFHVNGWAESVVAQNDVRGSWKTPTEQSRFQSQRMELELEPATNAPRLLTSSGEVRADWGPVRGGASRRLETSAVRFTFAQTARKPRRVQRAETLAPGMLELVAGDDTTRIRGQRLLAEFDARNRVQALRGTGGVDVERRLARSAPQSSRSDELAVRFASGGDWTNIEQRGDVRFREAAGPGQGERTAEAQRATFARTTETITLTGSATVSDSLTRTTADSLAINQRTGEITGDGNVRTTYRAAESAGVTNLAPQPAHLFADKLRADRGAGRALYSGRARLWQGDAVIEAGSIELFREERKLEARGNVSGIFPQAADPQAPANPARPPSLWRVHGAALIYWSAERRAQLEGNASAQSDAGQITARAMELFFDSAPGEPQRLARAAGSGGVTVRQGARRGTADRAEYVVAEEKFVLSGGTPTLFDAVRGTTTGRQLTFFLADDRILIDSQEGSRTLTRHRIEK